MTEILKPAGLPAVAIDPFRRDWRRTLPLSESQGEMLAAVQLGDEASLSFNQVYVLTLVGPLDADALQEALNAVVRKHPALRAGFHVATLCQEIAADLRVELPTEDISTLAPDARTSKLAQEIESQCRTPFDLSLPPLIRARLYRQEPGRHVLVVAAHHIVCDGWSSAILFTDLGLAYQAALFGMPANLAPTADYAAYIEGQSSPAAVEAAQRDKRFWKQQYADEIPVLELPLEGVRPAQRTFPSRHSEIVIGPDLYAQLRKAGAKQGCTMFATLLAGFELLLARLSSKLDFVVGIPVAGQSALPNPRLVAHAVNTVPLRCRIDEKATVADHLKNVRRTVADALEHQALTFGALLSTLEVPRDASRSPLVAVTFNIDKLGAPFDFGSLKVESVETPKQFVTFEMSVNVIDRGADAVVECDFNSDLFAPEVVAHWLRCYRQLLLGMALEPTAPIMRLGMLDRADEKIITGYWNNTDIPMPMERRLHALFEAQVARTPQAVALVTESGRLTYRELNARANRLARLLQQRGAGPERIIGVCLGRDLDLIVSLLAVLKSGSAYVPLDPKYPADRLKFMLEDSRALFVISSGEILKRLPSLQAATFVLEEQGPALAAQDDVDLSVDVNAGNLAYLIYTSGSTGVPKGVAIEHSSAGVLCHWARSVYTDDEIRGVLAGTSVCFDLSIFEIFFPLAYGGTVVLVENALQLMDSAGPAPVTLVNSVPSVATELVKAEAIPSTVRVICLAGEPLPQHLVEALYSVPGVAKVYDLYGPSEDTTYSTMALRMRGAKATIGKPIANTRAYILDRFLQPVPIGVAGELCLAGEGLARGYLGRDSLTAEKFVSDSVRGGEGRRMYRTGDMARFRVDGNIEYLGRFDHQVKLRGFRIELGEIDAAIRRHPGVTDVAVVVQGEPPVGPQINAYVVLRPGVGAGDDVIAQIRDMLRAQLPEYMVPSAMMALAALPRTPNGKLDRKALPAPAGGGAEASDAAEMPPSDVEKQISGIWKELLQSSTIGPGDNFFALGGHSLLAARMIGLVGERLGVDISLRRFLLTSSLRELAELVSLSKSLSADRLPAGEDSSDMETHVI